ncbi:MAG: hypothetical protein GHCLOJNM_03901 [bacterium]|nr:hypothetical protein [bacterium]
MAKKPSKIDSPELREILRAEREALYSGVSMDGDAEDRWEQAWDSSTMINITAARLEAFPHPIPLKGLEVLPATRIWGRLLDYFFVGFGVFVVDTIGGLAGFGLTRIAKLVFGEIGLKPGEYQYSTFLDPTGLAILTGNAQAMRKVLLLVFLILLVHRLIFYLCFRRTLGQMFAGVMITNGEGKYPTFGGRILKAVTTSIADASIVGNVVDLVFYAALRPQVSATDAISGVRAVRYDGWRNSAARLISRLHTLRSEGHL